MLNEKLGTNRETFTRKSSFEVSIRPEYRQALLEKIYLLSYYSRAIIVKTQLFVNFYVIHHEGPIPAYCFTQNFFYSVMQLIQGRTMTSNTDKCPNDLIQTWHYYKDYLYEILEVDGQEIANNNLRTSDVLTEACVTLSTVYQNHIVENFNGRIYEVFKYKIQTAFPVIDN
jgi:hypothetical protein